MNGIFGTLLVLMILLLIVALIIRGMLRDRKAGKSAICGGCCKTCGGCCGSCRGCPGSSMNRAESHLEHQKAI